MRKSQKSLTLALVLLSGSALADGPGKVTAKRTEMPSNPICTVFQTNNQSKAYGFSRANFDSLSTIDIAFMLQNVMTVDFEEDWIGSNPDCPNNVIGIRRLDLGKWVQ